MQKTGSTLDLVLESKRIRLVAVSPKYADEMFRYFRGDLLRYMSPPESETVEEMLEVINQARKKMRDGVEFFCVVVDRQTGIFLGSGGVHKLDTNMPEFSLWIAPPMHWNGYGFEVISLLRDWIASVGHWQYALYPVDERNIPSRRIAEKLGWALREWVEEETVENPRRKLRIVRYHIPLSREK